MDGITIDTEVRAGELGLIAEQHGRIYREEFDLDHRFEAYVALGVGEAALVTGELAPRFWIVRERERFVGSVAICLPEAGVGQLRWFLVESRLRGKGIGEQLMRQSLAYALGAGCTSVFLWTIDALEAAATLYRRHGFVETEREPGAPWGPPVVQVRFDLRLA